MKIQLAGHFGCHQAPVGRLAVKDDVLSGVLQPARDAVQIERRRNAENRHERNDRRGRKKPFAGDHRHERGRQQIQAAGDVQHAEMAQYMSERHDKGDSAEHVPQVVEQVDSADFRRSGISRTGRLRLPQRRGGDLASRRQGVPHHQAIRRQQHEAACHGLRHSDFHAVEKDDVPQPAKQKHVGDRQQGDEDFGDEERRDRPAQPRDRLAQRRAHAGQQHPVAQNDAKHQFISRKCADELSHERQLRQEGRQAEATDGKRESGRGEGEATRQRCRFRTCREHWMLAKGR